MVAEPESFGFFDEEPPKASQPAPAAAASAPSQEFEEKHTSSRFLLFRLGEQMFGTSLLNVREIIEPIVCKPIPNTVSHFLGVINLRGQIISIIDLKQKFGMPAAADAQRRAYVIFETPSGPIGAVVDEVTQVANLAEAEIDSEVRVSARVPLNFLSGMAKHNGKLVTLIDLKLVLGADELVSIRALRAKVA